MVTISIDLRCIIGQVCDDQMLALASREAASEVRPPAWVVSTVYDSIVKIKR